MTDEASGSGLNRSRRYFKQNNPTWLPKSGQEAQRGRREDNNEQSGNIVEGLLEIVNMITDNPGLKSDLQEYFENSKKEGKEDKRRINKKKRRERAPEKEVGNLDQMIKDYRHLVEKQQAEEVDLSKDLDGEMLPPNSALQGFKKTFTSVDVADSYQEMPMELDSDNEDEVEKYIPPPSASDPRLTLHHSKTHLYGQIREMRDCPQPFYHSASARDSWQVPTQTYGYPAFRPRPDPGAPCLLPPPPPPFRSPLLNPPRPPIDLASVPLPPLPPPLPARPAPPPTDTVLLSSIPLPDVKPELIDLSSPVKMDPKEIYIVSSDSSDEGSYCEDSYAEDSVQSDGSVTPRDKKMTDRKSREITTPENDVTRATAADEVPSDDHKSVKSRVSSSESLFSDNSGSESSSSSSSSSSDESTDTRGFPVATISDEIKRRLVPSVEKGQGTKENREGSSEDEDVNNRYNLLDASDEEKVEEEDAAVLRLKLLDSIRTIKVTPKSDPFSETNMKPEEEIDTGNTNEGSAALGIDGKSDCSGSEGEPLVKRQSKRKKSAPIFTFPQVLEMVKTLPVIDMNSFREFYETKRQQKKARARARRAKMFNILELVKEELHFDPAEERWFIYGQVGQPPSGIFPYSRIARFKLPSAKFENLQNITPLRMDETLDELKKRRLERFYKLSEKVQNKSNPKPDPPSSEISPKEIKVTILKHSSLEEGDKAAVDKFKSTFTETQKTNSSDAVVESFLLKSASSKPSNISEAHTVKVIQSNDQCKLVATQNVQKNLPTKEKRDPHCKTVLKIVNLGKGRLNRKISEDDLDGMRELLLQSMIKKTKETEKPPTQSDVKTNLPVVQIKTKALPSPRSSPPPKGEKQPTPPTSQTSSEPPNTLTTFKTTDSKTEDLTETSNKPPNPAVPSKNQNNKTISIKSKTKSVPKTATATTFSKPTDPLASITQKAVTPPTVMTSPDVVLGEGSESLMPRSLSTITPAAVKRSNENTRKLISRLLVNEDLRIPQKDTKLNPEAQAEREKLLRRITPKINPIVIKLGESESESESDQATTPVKQKVLLSPVPRSGAAGGTKLKINRQRSTLTLKVAQLEQRLIQYTMKRNQHQEEHGRHCERVQALEKQLSRTRDIVVKSEEILNTIDERRNVCILELRTRSAVLQNLVLRLDHPEKWAEVVRKKKEAAKPSTLSSEVDVSSSCDRDGSGSKSEEIINDAPNQPEKDQAIQKQVENPKKPEEDSTIIVKPSEDKLDNKEGGSVTAEGGGVTAEGGSVTAEGGSVTAELEPGELASDKSSSEEDENPIEQAVNKDGSEPQDVQSAHSSLLSTESLLEYCRSQLSLTPGPSPPPPVVRPVTEFIPICHPSTELSVCSHSRYQPYKSPLTAFRSYRFSPYYRIKCHLTLSSSTFTNSIKTDIPLCPHDLHGKCFDKSCNRQHLSGAMKMSGAQLRTQLCLSAGVSIAEVRKFETAHKTLKDEEMNILFCDHLNSLRNDRGRDTSYVNTRHIPPVLTVQPAERDRTTVVDRVAVYNSTQPSSSSKYEKLSTRYCTSVSELTLTQQCRSSPKVAENWLDLAACQTSRGAEVGVVIATLSKALQANKNSTALWTEYLRVKSLVISVSDLTGLYQQALRLAPSPLLWRNFAPKLNSLKERISALDSALQICDMTTSADKKYYGDLLRDKLLLIYHAGQDSMVEQFDIVFQDLGKLLNHHLVWFVQQYISYLQNGEVLEDPAQITIQPNNPPSRVQKVLDLREKLVSSVSDDTKILLVLHRLFSKLLALSTGPEQAIDYLFEVSEKVPELYELLEDIVELGGWVEPDVPWPKLVYLQMGTAEKNGHPELALTLSRGLVTTLSGSSAENTLQLYREVLGLTIGARVVAQYDSLSRGLHRTWLHLCYGLTAHLNPVDPVLQYKLFSTRLATVFPSSEQLNALRDAISNEPSTQGAQILWIRYLDVLEKASEKDKQLISVLQREMLHCIKSVPTLSNDNFSFHNQVISALVSHYATPQERFREISHHLLTYRKNKELLMLFYNELAHSNPLSTVQLFKELLKDNPSCPKLWSKLMELSESCQIVTETREIARTAINTLPLNSSLLLQTLVFELRNCSDAEDQRNLTEWALKRAKERGIAFKASCSEGNNLLPSA
ncbi:uncharacterized protein LOC134814904 [Bolinopsis microptera]|uniref:uncharacterized protein LOC134814904 n=1 Tax=Bolinopsis microptera TaxID=2820187 RepID=UPI003079E2BC